MAFLISGSARLCNTSWLDSVKPGEELSRLARYRVIEGLFPELAWAGMSSSSFKQVGFLIQGDQEFAGQKIDNINRTVGRVGFLKKQYPALVPALVRRDSVMGIRGLTIAGAPKKFLIQLRDHTCKDDQCLYLLGAEILAKIPLPNARRTCKELSPGAFGPISKFH